jgi:site-specific DNA-cytosine methylase
MKLLDLFSGIGGFHQGFTQAGYTFDWVGFSDIDKYASAVTVDVVEAVARIIKQKELI